MGDCFLDNEIKMVLKNIFFFKKFVNMYFKEKNIGI